MNRNVLQLVSLHQFLMIMLLRIPSKGMISFSYGCLANFCNWQKEGLFHFGLRTVFSSFSYAENSKKKQRWALKTFEQWRDTHNRLVCPGRFTGEVILTHFSKMTPDQLNCTVPRFIHEVAKKDRTPYPAETLYSMVMCLQAHCHSHGFEYKFLDSSLFAPIRNTLDNRMKELSSKGIVTAKKQAEPISLSEEEKLWQLGLLGDKDPETLLNMVIYLLGVHLALCSCQEHKDLKMGAYRQINICFDEEKQLRYLHYVPTHRKNYQGGIKELNKKRKDVRVYENVDNPHRCVVRLYEKYIGLRLTCDPKCSADLYLHPLLHYKNDGSPWYSCQSIGIHTLQNVTAAMCACAGLSGKRGLKSIMV